jgi:hypothetical protein
MGIREVTAASVSCEDIHTGLPEQATCPLDNSSIDESVLLKGISLPRMVLHLAELQHVLIRNMIASKTAFKANEIANVAGCSLCNIHRIRSNIHDFGSTRAPLNTVRHPRSVTSLMLETLCEHLLEKPELYQEEMVLFL